MTTVHDPLNVVAFMRADALLPDPWRVYLEIPFGPDGAPHVIVRAPIGTPVPDVAREVHRTVVPTKVYPPGTTLPGHRPGPSGVRGDLPLTPAERHAVDVQRRWRTAPVPGAQPFPNLDAVLDDLASALSMAPDKPVPGTATLFHEPTTTDPWVCPHHLTIGDVVKVAVRLPDSPLTTVVVREPARGASRWTVALGVGSRMRHLQGGYRNHQEALDAALIELHAARRAATQAMVEARGADRWSLWGVSWRTYLQTITVVTAAHHQNAYDAYRDSARVVRIDDPTLGGLVDGV